MTPHQLSLQGHPLYITFQSEKSSDTPSKPNKGIGRKEQHIKPYSKFGSCHSHPWSTRWKRRRPSSFPPVEKFSWTLEKERLSCGSTTDRLHESHESRPPNHQCHSHRRRAHLPVRNRNKPQYGRDVILD